MASYALPASAMTHSHLGHGHVRTHSRAPSHGPSRQSSFSGSPSKIMKREMSSGSIHIHKPLGIQHDHGHAHQPQHDHGHDEPAIAPEPYSNGSAHVANQGQKTTHATAAPEIYESPAQNVKHSHHDHEHKIHDHVHKHGHPHGHKHESKSKFTNMLLPMVQNHPLLHTILAEKDSRRIFYFMRWAYRLGRWL